MTTTNKDYHEFAGGLSTSALAFNSVSFMGAASAIGLGIATSFGWSITNLGAGAEDRAISATDTSAANAHATLATLIRELGKKGILTVTG
jgi:hypothetical protein